MDISKYKDSFAWMLSNVHDLCENGAFNECLHMKVVTGVWRFLSIFGQASFEKRRYRLVCPHLQGRFKHSKIHVYCIFFLSIHYKSSTNYVQLKEPECILSSYLSSSKVSTSWVSLVHLSSCEVFSHDLRTCFYCWNDIAVDWFDHTVSFVTNCIPEC